MDALGGLDKPLQDALAQGGKLDIVAKGLAKAGWDELALRNYAKQVKALGADNPFVKQIDELATAGPEPVGYIIGCVYANVKNGGVRGLWDTADTMKRGDAIAYLKGQNLPQNFPIIDYWDEVSGTAKSMKSLDPTLSTFIKTPERIFTDGRDYVDEILDLQQTIKSTSKQTGITYTVDVSQLQTRMVDLFIPTGSRLDARFQSYFQRILEYGQSKTVVVNLIKL